MAETAPNRNPQNAGASTPRAPRFLVEQRPWSQSFFSSLVEFLTEKPVKIRDIRAGAPFTPSKFGAGFGENFKEWLKGGSKVPLPKGQRMLVEDKPFLRVLWEDIRFAIAPPKLPPLNVTSKPIPVKPIWSKDENYSKAQMLSLVAHGLAIVLLTMPLVYRFIQNTTAPPVVKADVRIIDISPYCPSCLRAAKERAAAVAAASA
jgi:hypothetical protein